MEERNREYQGEPLRLFFCCRGISSEKDFLFQMKKNENMAFLK